MQARIDGMKRSSILVFFLLAVVLSVLRVAAQGVATPADDVDSDTFLALHGTDPTPPRPEISRRVAELLARMSLKEKIGQMTQFDIFMIADGKGQAIRIDPAKLDEAVVEYGVGSIINVDDEALPPEIWHEILGQIQAAAGRTRLGIPVLYGIDSVHGANYVAGATLFPHNLGMASTWNPGRMLEASRHAAAETRAAGLAWNFSPVLDVGRQPLWPRLFETFGEDPYLASVMGVAAVRGYEGDDPSAPTRVAATLKHYVGYSAPTSGHDRTPALIPEGTLREIFLPPFTAGVRAGARSVMVNSGEVNGVPGHVDRHLLTDVLRGELGFTGLIVSDWEDIKKLVRIHRVAATEKEAIRLAILAGIDVSMVPRDYSFPNLLAELVEEGAVPMARIDEAVGRMLRLKLELGLFDDPLGGTRSGVRVGSPEAWQAALEAARESVILLKNEGVGGGAPLLPLRPGSRILLTGPTADSRIALNSGWSLSWQGNREELYDRFYPGSEKATLRGALEARFGADRVTYVPGATFDTGLGLAAAAAAARQADVAIIALGEDAYCETPGNIDDLDLPPAQLRLAREVAATGTPVILVLIEGRPRIIRPIADSAAGIVLAFNPGLAGGRALADVLAGDVNPGGRLPITYPRSASSLRTYDHKSFEELDTDFGLTGFRPQFEFGFGLSYTVFEYSELTVNPRQPNRGEEVTVAVTVKNTGPRPGAEVVQLYVSDHVASVTPPVARLRRFARVELEPGESRRLTFTLRREDLSFIGRDLAPTLEPGVFGVLVGGLQEAFLLR